jgi:hypothetical protein
VAPTICWGALAMSDELRQYLAEQEREAREGAADPTTPATYGSYADPRLNSDSEAPTTRSVLARMDAQQAAEQRKPYEAMKNLAVTMMGPFTAGAAAANNYRNVGKAIQRHVAQERKEGNWQMAPVPLSIYGGVFGSLGPLAYTLAANSPGWQSWAGAAGAAGAGATALAAKMGLHEHSLSTARILRHLNRTDPVGRTLYADGGTAHLRQYLEEQGITVPEGWESNPSTVDVLGQMPAAPARGLPLASSNFKQFEWAKNNPQVAAALAELLKYLFMMPIASRAGNNIGMAHKLERSQPLQDIGGRHLVPVDPGITGGRPDRNGSTAPVGFDYWNSSAGLRRSGAVMPMPSGAIGRSYFPEAMLERHSSGATRPRADNQNPSTGRIAQERRGDIKMVEPPPEKP